VGDSHGGPVGQVLRLWQAAHDWVPHPALVARAREVGRTHYRGGWPGFAPEGFRLRPAPSPADAVVLLSAYRDWAQLNVQHFGAEVPPAKIVLNARLLSTGGRIDTRLRVLELNPWRLRELPETGIETIFHEMIHLWLYAQGLPSGHTAAFKVKMTERGHHSIRYGVPGDPKGPRHAYPGSDRRVVYRCVTCGHEYRRRQQFRQTMLCGVCLRERGERCRLELVAVLRGQPPR